jgi:hypothetical protein
MSYTTQSDGIVSTFAGNGNNVELNGTGTSASFNFPRGVTTDVSGNVYVADSFNGKVRKITPSKVVSTLATAPADAVAVDLSGNVYALGGLRVRKITPAGVVTILAGNGEYANVNGPGVSASFGNTFGIAINSSGILFVADNGHGNVRKITTDGVVSRFDSGGNPDPFGIAVDSSDNVYVVNRYYLILNKYNSAGQLLLTLDQNNPNRGWNFRLMVGVAVDSSGTIFIGEQTRISKFSFTGNTIERITVAGDSTGYLDGVGTNAQFDGTGYALGGGIGIDLAGNVYVADSSNHRIRKINPNPNTFSDAPLTGTLLTSFNPSLTTSTITIPAGTTNANVARFTVPASSLPLKTSVTGVWSLVLYATVGLSTSPASFYFEVVDGATTVATGTTTTSVNQSTPMQLYKSNLTIPARTYTTDLTLNIYATTQASSSLIIGFNGSTISYIGTTFPSVGPTGFTGATGAASTVTGPTGIQGHTGPTGPAAAGGGSVSIVGSTGFSSVLTVATGGTGVFGNANLTFNGSSLSVTGNEVVKFNGTNGSNAYGSGLDTLTLQSTSNAYSNAIASMFFGNATSGYPLGRIYGLDTASASPASSALVFQTANAIVNGALTGSNIFTYTGSDQNYTVPVGITSIVVTMWGAGGGGATTNSGGPGAFVSGTLSVTPGDTLKVIVGQGGPQIASSVYGGGGPSSSNGAETWGRAGSGGGRSALQRTLTSTITGSNITTSGGVVTYPTSAAHGLFSNQPVIITGITPNGYNGTYVVSTIPTSNSFTVSNATTGSGSGTGTIVAELVNIAGGGGGSSSNVAVGGYGGLINGGRGVGQQGGGYGGTQTAGGARISPSTAGSVLLGGTGVTSFSVDAPGGGGGYFGGGGGTAYPDNGGGGGSSYLSNITIISSGETTSGRLAPGTTNPFYVSGVGNGNSNGSGGNGLVVISTNVVFTLSEAMRIHSNGYLGIGTTSPATHLDVSGGLTIRNGFRPLYMNVSGTSLTVASNSFGTHYNITNSGFSSLTLPAINWSNDSNGYWVFRNNTSSYLSTTVTYTTAGTSAPTNPVVIPPANSTTIMVTYPGASTSNYVLF